MLSPQAVESLAARRDEASKSKKRDSSPAEGGVRMTQQFAVFINPKKSTFFP